MVVCQKTQCVSSGSFWCWTLSRGWLQGRCSSPSVSSSPRGECSLCRPLKESLVSVLLKKELIFRFCGEAFVSTLLLLVVCSWTGSRCRHWVDLCRWCRILTTRSITQNICKRWTSKKYCNSRVVHASTMVLWLPLVGETYYVMGILTVEKMKFLPGSLKEIYPGVKVIKLD